MNLFVLTLVGRSRRQKWDKVVKVVQALVHQVRRRDALQAHEEVVDAAGELTVPGLDEFLHFLTLEVFTRSCLLYTSDAADD